jgi:hypothetical protein
VAFAQSMRQNDVFEQMRIIARPLFSYSPDFFAMISKMNEFGGPVFQRSLLRGPSRLAFWRTMSSGRVKVRLRLRDGLLTRLNIRHRNQDRA